MSDLPDNVVDLARVRALKEFEGEEDLAYVEILWGERGAFGVHAAIRDLEAMRKGTEDPAHPLRDPETTFEAEAILRRIRYVANFLAHKWGLDHQVHPEDWQGGTPPPSDG